MITKERLEELIEQGVTIYGIMKNPFIAGYSDFIEVEKLDLKAPVVKEISEDGKQLLYWNYLCNLEDLFETEEDARWELEMTGTRTETLKLPKFEEAQDEKFHFSYLIDVKGLHLYISIYNFTKRFEIYCNHGTHTYDYRLAKTFDLSDKKQYEMACKLCLELFKGKEV